MTTKCNYKTYLKKKIIKMFYNFKFHEFSNPNYTIKKKHCIMLVFDLDYRK